MDVEAEIAELRQQAGARNDAELASLLFIHRSAISQWRKRGSVPDKAKAAVQKLKANQQADRDAANELNAVPPGVRQLARALAIYYSTPSDYDVDQPSQRKALARELKLSALHFYEAERAAALLLTAVVENEDGDVEAAYEWLLNSSWFNKEMTEIIIAPQSFRRGHGRVLPQALPQSRKSKQLKR